ncbi:hypothetical protein [Salipiger mangrovisoli]|uniref:Uncharacterized protein n=1 Tax=Salipiger mangrovisoli TaxID=2865933 RepID=A0ABR9XBB8_9RHOB|nr:hypothetical protein [Salipiger mangrovisoli]MBE9640915.1 hypothetical protein [Salipiger mangrovisoli]
MWAALTGTGMKSVEKRVQIHEFVGRQRLLGLGETAARAFREGQVSGGTHGCNADRQGEDLWHWELRRCLR